MSRETWYEDLFDERYLDFYPYLRRHPVAEDDARFLVDALELRPGAAVLDLGCGTGRHSVALAELGMAVTGLDLSPVLLAQARATAVERGVEVEWVERDMRDLDGLGPFDACVCLFTAFGFFGDADDQEVLHQVAAALRPRGTLLLDVSNHLAYLRRFPKNVWHENDRAVLRERNLYDPTTGTLITYRSGYWKAGGKLELPPSRVRAYFPHELHAMLGRAGLSVERVYGALDEVPFSWAESPNQVFLARNADDEGCAGEPRTEDRS